MPKTGYFLQPQTSQCTTAVVWFVMVNFFYLFLHELGLINLTDCNHAHHKLTFYLINNSLKNVDSFAFLSSICKSFDYLSRFLTVLF